MCFSDRINFFQLKTFKNVNKEGWGKEQPPEKKEKSQKCDKSFWRSSLDATKSIVKITVKNGGSKRKLAEK